MACFWWLQHLALSTAATSYALAWTSSWAKWGSDGLNDRRARLPWLANYDDQSVKGVPSRTRDFEHTTARKAVPFYPETKVPVVEVKPLQETFTGIHSLENELFRAEVSELREKFFGGRVVSGLAVDDDGRQHQAHGPAASYQSVLGVAPLCETYSNPAMSLGDWENPVTWQNVLESGIMRLTPASIIPVDKPMSILLTGHECNAARSSVFIRLGSASEGGIIFRAKSLEDYFAATLDIEKRILSLQRTTSNAARSTLAEAAVFYVNPSIRHQIAINDPGGHGLLKILLDNKVVISYLMPSKEKARFGLKVSRGTALFDGFAIEQ